MTLSDLGITQEITSWIIKNNYSEFIAGRVIRENRERYIVSSGEKEYESEITGNMRFTAESRAGYPCVGDWVLMKTYEPDLAIIHVIVPRKSVLERQSVGKAGEKQLISANVDTALIVQSIDNNFSINRLERYLSICYNAGIEPVLVISKVDLADEETVRSALDELGRRDEKIKCFLLSNTTLKGLDQISGSIEKGKTYCVVGSSGVGKSSLINNLLKEDVLKTGRISRSTNKGRHISDHRELFVLENGGIIIDNPGMRELGMTDNADGILTTFDKLSELARNCRFPDCRHISERGCAILEALDNGIIDRKSADNFLKMLREQQLFQSTVAERREKDRKFGKMLKNYYKQKDKEL